MAYISSSPIPDPRQKPQFRIRYEKEVVPPTKQEVDQVLAIDWPVLPEAPSSSPGIRRS